jgi:hypothetical protein
MYLDMAALNSPFGKIGSSGNCHHALNARVFARQQIVRGVFALIFKTFSSCHVVFSLLSWG